MSSPVVLAYSGSLEASAAIPWLAEHCAAEVVTLTLDVGQDQPVEQLRARALACGARRAHVIDVRDEFARECVVPSMRGTPPGSPLLVASLARPMVARRLIELAAIEGADAVAHASRDHAFHEQVATLNPALRVLAPVRDWRMDARELAAFARARGVPNLPPASGASDNLLLRRVHDPAGAPDGEARLELTFRGYVPVALNAVAMSAAELLESVSLIAGQYGVGWGEPVAAPAALVLRAAYAVLPEPDGTITLKVARGEHAVLASGPHLVTVA
jgi:argininosuccinate synthase